MINHPYSVKNIKRVRGTDGYGFTATLYFGNKRLGTVMDHANGAPLFFEVEREAKQALELYAKGLPDKICDFNDPQTGQPAVVKYTAELLVDQLVNQAQSLKQVKNILKKGSTIAIIGNRKVYKIEYMGPVGLKIIANYKKENPEAIVLNGLSDEEIMATMEAHGCV
ncbi:hypothetical protein [Acidithiobacillus thiooxidans]|uniref:hypothetical protein n=1 Tax=Acidithiobacillus thiooxidans TaxID=930 RepID=UPI0009DABB82|nr:hypothetical protein [Acidithiobacillus thiooxidans]